MALAVTLWGGNKLFNKNFSFTGGEHKELIPPIGLNRHSVSPTHEHIDLVYFATALSDAVVPENQTDSWRWCTKEDLSSLELLNDVRFYAELALDTLQS